MASLYNPSQNRAITEFDRRRHVRFDSSAVKADVSVLSTDTPHFLLVRCRPANVSYGGMCLKSNQAFEPGREYRFLIRLQEPFRDFVLVKARVVWTRTWPDQSGYRFGLKFLESSKGWLGPEDNSTE
ncbi:MAG: PilZ domain-containing protein [Acidobacteriota bacterium]